MSRHTGIASLPLHTGKAPPWLFSRMTVLSREIITYLAAEQGTTEVLRRLFDAGAIVTTPFNDGRGTLAVAGRYSYTGLLFSMFSPDYTFSYWDYQARLSKDSGATGAEKISFFAFGKSSPSSSSTWCSTCSFSTFIFASKRSLLKYFITKRLLPRVRMPPGPTPAPPSHKRITLEGVHAAWPSA